MQPLRLLPALLVLVFSAAACAQNAILHSWDFPRAFGLGACVEVPETAGGPALLFRSSASLQTDADEQGRQVLVLDGKQTDWGRTKSNIAPISALRMRLRFRPNGGGAPLQTIVTVSGCYELRYNLARARLEFIINLPDKKYLAIHAEASPGVWNQAVATYQDGKLTLAVGLARAEDTLPEGLRPVPVSTTVRVGHFADRPFNGSISEFTILEN